MQKAFTYLELVIVIVLIGILATLSLGRLNRDHLYEATDQLVSHLRYAQHLSMIDDKYDAQNQFHYRENYQVVFNQLAGDWRYSVFSDGIDPTNPANDYDGTPDIGLNEVVPNPISQGQFLTGGYGGYLNGPAITDKLNLTNAYGIQNILFSNSCQVNGSQRIAFDYLGRPMIGDIGSYNSQYDMIAGNNRLLQQDCNITLIGADDENVTITIRPETGSIVLN